MTPSQIEQAAREYASTIEPDRLGCGDLESAFEAGADFILQKQWISVQKELPADNEQVLVISYGTTYKATFIATPRPHFIMEWDKTGDLSIIYLGDNVTHWAHIPQLPKQQ